MIDLRSDTVTRPTPAMRKAMAEAEVGDDVYREDPTVNALEARAAELLGKPAALFVPTGSMGNAIAIKLHTHHGQEVICDDKAHILDWELSMTAWFSGCLARPIPRSNGILNWNVIEPQIKNPGGFSALTAMVNLEHPHNMGGGSLYAIQAIDDIATRAHARNLKVHMDGARLFNAVARSGLTPARIVQNVDTVMTCLSKGLGAPVGSLLAGSADLIAQARIYRKNLGGGMRQSGILAAAGLIALDESPQKMFADHDHARMLATAVGIDPATIQTNIVIFEIDSNPAEFIAALKAEGVLASAIGGQKIRLVTHYDVSREDCERAAQVLAQVLSL
ncbi:MAG: GntG family PLP-dependent aldolase [Bryobacteraceae bacterium]